MKNTSWGMAAFFLVIIIGCNSGYSGSGNSQNNPSNSSTGNSSSSSNSGNAQPQSNSSNVDVINIPSQSQSAPSGILEQLSWVGRGGGPMYPPCGDCTAELAGGKIILRDFEPYQNLYIPIYRDTGEHNCGYGRSIYVVASTVQVNEDGYLEINLSGLSNNLQLAFIFDADNGEEVWHDNAVSDYIDCEEFGSSNSSCPGAPPQRLEVGEMAYVCTSSDSVKLREGAGRNYSVIKSLVPGADLKIIGGPKCGDNWSWWQVETESGFVGWMSEGGDSTDKYFLCPLP